MIGQIPNEKVEERYSNVNFELKYPLALFRQIVVKDLTLTVSTHRLIFTCDNPQSLLLDLSTVTSVDLKVLYRPA